MTQRLSFATCAPCHPEFITVTIAQAEGEAAAESGFSLMDAVLDAGPIGMLTLLLLLFFSIASWAIILLKWKAIRGAGKAVTHFLGCLLAIQAPR